jgi:hypothetical protein
MTVDELRSLLDNFSSIGFGNVQVVVDDSQAISAVNLIATAQGEAQGWVSVATA